MPLYAGVCETDITPPIGVEMNWNGTEPRRCTSILDPLYARALVLENGHSRLVLVVADLYGLPTAVATEMRQTIAKQMGIGMEAVMLHCTHTHGGPNTGTHTGFGRPDAPYMDVLGRKAAGVALQAASTLQPARIVYGEASAQIGVNRRQTRTDGTTGAGQDFGGMTLPTVQVVCINGLEGRLQAMLFSHACHPTTLSGHEHAITAEWPGAAVQTLKDRFRSETSDGAVSADALPIFVQGCSGDIGPLRTGSREALRENGAQVGMAAHAARWNAHGHQGDTLHAEEVLLQIPARHKGKSFPFAVQHWQVGDIHVLGFPGELFAPFQQDFAAQSRAPVLALNCTNGYTGYLPTQAEFARGGYEVDESCRHIGGPQPAAQAELVIRAAVYSLLGVEEPDFTSYPLQRGRPR